MPTLSPAHPCVGLPTAVKLRTPSHGDQDTGQPRCTRWGRAPWVSLPTAPRGCLVCQMLKEPAGSPGTASTGRCGEVSRVSQPVMTRGGARAQLQHGWDRNGGEELLEPRGDRQQVSGREPALVGVTPWGRSSHLVSDTPRVPQRGTPFPLVGSPVRPATGSPQALPGYQAGGGFPGPAVPVGSSSRCPLAADFPAAL